MIKSKFCDHKQERKSSSWLEKYKINVHDYEQKIKIVHDYL